MGTKNPLSIKEIFVDKLFGYYTYKIPVEPETDISQLLILYGDNGSGKTTLLKLIFWLLSSRDRSGYKTKIAETKFKSFSIVFENGIKVGANREGSSLIGSYTYYIEQSKKTVHSLKLKTTSRNAISLQDGTKENGVFKKILDYIKELNISVFYLSDDRKILNSLTSSEHETENYGNIILNDSDLVLTRDYERVGIKRMLDEKKLALEPAIERLIDWIRTKVISGSKTGDKNSQAIFTDLIRNVSKPNEAIKRAKTKEQLIHEIDIIEKKVQPFVRLGLIETFDSKTIKTAIDKSNSAVRLRNLRIILAPYIESINAKLEALEKLKDTIYLFLDSTNAYFTNKAIDFNLSTGFSLCQKGGEPIDFNLLSSGEKQLLLLLINTITAADVATIFIIDEPEISLNIKWQRNLIDTLLKFSSNKNIQYILSTHSLELLSSNLDKVTKLEEVNASV
ncbi:AAA family ATPase [Flavisolibacter nicotianae]|uniref:AAA family ATPase n=1 Tax=Flavisolibacter nicotianae TaxID=2364882 RepID=UPI000EB540D8|nr:AAA family ATPase [Flavisolibacter nicotianae]